MTLSRSRIRIKLYSPNVKMIFTLIIFFYLYLFINGEKIVNAESDEEFKGTEYCITCHPKQSVQWSKSAHAKAYSNEDFQKIWTDLEQDEECLECHTTGYNPRAGYEGKDIYLYQEIQCEECHGPGNTMNRNTSPELCGECHSGPYPTYEEWINSGPSHGEADCLKCHEEHSASLEFQTTTETCSQCHESHVEQVDETLHAENNVECEDCHMLIEEADFYSGKQARTGHSFNPSNQELDCSSCHEIKLDKHDALGEKSAACLSCHGDIHELRLELLNGQVYDNEDSVQLCAQCHNERYTVWKEGTHGSYDDPQAGCTICHEPHKPIINQISTLESIPQRESAKASFGKTTMILILLLELIGFSIWIYWSKR